MHYLITIKTLGLTGEFRVFSEQDAEMFFIYILLFSCWRLPKTIGDLIVSSNTFYYKKEFVEYKIGTNPLSFEAIYDSGEIPMLSEDLEIVLGIN